jgi:hypothetical protein
MNYPIAVSVIEGGSDLAPDGDSLREGNALLNLKALPQSLTFDERHHIVQKSFRLARVMEWNNVRVIQTRCRLYFVEKAVGAHGRRNLAMQNLHGDFATVSLI